MALVTITGTLTDFGLQALTPYSPQIVFRPNGPSYKGFRILSTRPVTAVPTGSGTFSVRLESSEDARPPQRLTVSAEWLEPGSGGAGGYRSVDLIENFQVPPGGGGIGDIAALDYDPTKVWVSDKPPLYPAYSTWWLNTITGDLMEWE